MYLVIMIIYRDEKFDFYEIFNEDNGTLIRSDVNGIDPAMRSFPELLDVGVMGHCSSGDYCKKSGIDCYQEGYERQTPNMTVDEFSDIARQASGKTFQIALGGAGDPNKHPEFEKILKICRFYRIVPNMTTSGFMITDAEQRLIRDYCGAVAVSWYSRLYNGIESNQDTINAVTRFVNLGCITNIHFVISNDTIDEAIERLEGDVFPKGISAVVFILYKPVGFGVKDKVIKSDDPRLKKFFSLVMQKTHSFRVGFDTCFTPAILNYASSISTFCIDACEAATFSMYIDSQLNCYPCSFGIWNKNICESMREKSLREIWNGDVFESFRKQKKNGCESCKHDEVCRGGCRLGLDIDLCKGCL